MAGISFNAFFSYGDAAWRNKKSWVVSFELDTYYIFQDAEPFETAEVKQTTLVMEQVREVSSISSDRSFSLKGLVVRLQGGAVVP